MQAARAAVVALQLASNRLLETPICPSGALAWFLRMSASTKAIRSTRSAPRSSSWVQVTREPSISNCCCRPRNWALPDLYSLVRLEIAHVSTTFYLAFSDQASKSAVPRIMANLIRLPISISCRPNRSTKMTLSLAERFSCRSPCHVNKLHLFLTFCQRASASHKPCSLRVLSRVGIRHKAGAWTESRAVRPSAEPEGGLLWPEAC